MRRTFIVLSFFCINLAFTQHKEHLFHDDLKRSWLTYLPENYTNNKTYPLLIALHGGGGSAKQLMNNTRKRFNELADSEGFIVVYPQGIKKSWNDNPFRDQNGFARKENIDDVGFIEKMMAQLKSIYSINEKAVFVCGISNGGLMSQTLAFELPDQITAIGMVAANFGKDKIERFEAIKPFSIMFIHGEDDPIFPYNEGEIGLFRQLRGEVLGIEKSIEFICELNGSSNDPDMSSIENIADDNCKAQHFIYPNSYDASLKVELIKVEGGGHTWPGAKEQRLISRIVGTTTQDFSACDKLWNFFKTTID